MLRKVVLIGLIATGVVLTGDSSSAQESSTGAQASRTDAIVKDVLKRASIEPDIDFDSGNYPRATQNLRIQAEIAPQDENVVTSLIWMLGNMRYQGEAIATAQRFRLDNPDNPDRGLPEAGIYFNLRAYLRIPIILEPDIKRTDPAPHRNTFSTLANAYYRMGFHKDVVRVLTVALSHYPDDGAFVRNKERSEQRMKEGG